jgi:hypothetical protein
VRDSSAQYAEAAENSHHYINLIVQTLPETKNSAECPFQPTNLQEFIINWLVLSLNELVKKQP